MTADSGVSRRGFLAALGSGITLAAANDAGPTEYPRYHAAGSHRELGRQHGEQAADKIKAHVVKIAAEGGYSHDQMSSRALAFEPLFQRY